MPKRVDTLKPVIPIGPVHYTVDRYVDGDVFIVQLYKTGLKELQTYTVSLESVHDILIKFNKLGYIADRIAF